MKYKLLFILIGSLFMCNVYAQGANDLLGKWTNAYGSLMDINNVSENQFTGTYSSTTGSTGMYDVYGKFIYNSETKNSALIITLSWSSIDGSTKDPSQFWTSVMSGTFFSDQKSMELINIISSASPFPAVQIEEPGMYPESLVFKKQSNELGRPAVLPILPEKEVTYNSPIEGKWENRDSKGLLSTIELKVSAMEHYNKLSGVLTLNNQEINIDGVLSFEDPDVGNQSFSFSALDYSSGKTLGITGIYHIASSSMDVLILQSNAVKYVNKYTSTSMDGSTFQQVKISKNKK